MHFEKPKDHTPGKLLESATHWKTYVEWHDPERWKRLMTPPKPKFKYRFRLWREKMGQDLINWSVRIMLYGINAPLWKFMLARPACYIGYFLTGGPAWYRAIQAIRCEARERMRYRGYREAVRYYERKM